VLNLFYLEPDPDRWFFGDRFPRKLIRRILRGPRRPGGQERVFLNLKAGLRQLGVPFRENDFAYARKHPEEPVGIIGKPHVLDMMEWENPILFGAAVMSHPLADPTLLQRRPIRKILVPGEWMRKMCEPYWGDKVEAWPVGIDTDLWCPAPEVKKEYDFLIYDKVYWERDRYEQELIEPIRSELRRQSLRFAEIRYGHYKEEDFHSLLKRCKAMIFLCEHETQGIAYQQVLSMDIPVLAWDRGGYWQDPEYYPHKVKHSPISSVPYWDDACGEKFSGEEAFGRCLEKYLSMKSESNYKPRKYIKEYLTLKKCAETYVRLLRQAENSKNV
jgi:hypothetical protein